MHIEKSKPWEGDKFLKGYPNEPHPKNCLNLFAKKRKSSLKPNTFLDKKRRPVAGVLEPKLF
jgi:hypothetical protein